MTSKASFKMIHCKDSGKKRKSFQDGLIITSVKNGGTHVSLTDDSHQHIWSGQSKATITEGFDGLIGFYHVVVEAEVREEKENFEVETVECAVSQPKLKPFAVSKRLKIEPSAPSSSSLSRSLLSSSSASASSGASEGSNKSLGLKQLQRPVPSKGEFLPTLDPILMKHMKPHQIEGANFLLNCLFRDDLLVPATAGSDGVERGDDDDDEDDGDFVDKPKFTPGRIHNGRSSYLDQRIRGCILADDMVCICYSKCYRFSLC